MGIAIWESIRQRVHRYFPGLAMHVRSLRIRRHVRLIDNATGTTRVRNLVIDRIGLRVVAGPFAGMEYVPQTVCSSLTPKLLGTYEAELADVFNQIFATPFTRIVDVGSAEGYYAVGLARRFPDAEIIAFDTDPHARRLCSSLAAKNGVADKVAVRGACTPAELARLAGGHVLVICDCEGYEAVLLDPQRVPSLSQCSILVECHDGLAPGVTDELNRRFAHSHRIETYPTRSREYVRPQQIDFLSPEDAAIAVSENRLSPQVWLWMTPK